MDFGERLVKIRTKRKMTQDDVAEKLDISRQTVYRWERGDNVPDISQLNTLCKLFKVFPEYFIDPDVDPDIAPDARSVYRFSEPKADSAGTRIPIIIIGLVIWVLLLITGFAGMILFFSDESVFLYSIVICSISGLGLLKSLIDIAIQLLK